MTVEEKIKRARVRMQKVSPFVYLLIVHMNIHPSDLAPTAWVGASGEMGYNEKWFASLNISQTAGVIAHEALHVALMHVLRMGGRHHEVWNVSIDLKVNDIIQDMIQSGSGLALPTPGIIPEHHSWSSGSIKIDNIETKGAEEIYSELYEKVPKIRIGGGKGKGKGGSKGKINAEGWDEHHQAKEDGGASAGDIERKWKQIVVQAATVQRMQGKIPGSLAACIDEILDSKIKWFDKLYRYITTEIPVDFTYLRPNKKSASLGVYMPDVVRERLQACIGIDTSGSVSDKELQEFMSEVSAIGRSFANVEMTVIVCDAQVQDVFELSGQSARDPLSRVKLKGRGGTDHRPVEKWIRENKPNAELVICLTDGYTTFPKDPTGRWMWVLTANAVADDKIPFGEVVRM